MHTRVSISASNCCKINNICPENMETICLGAAAKTFTISINNEKKKESIRPEVKIKIVNKMQHTKWNAN